MNIYRLTAKVLCCLISSSDIDCRSIFISSDTSLSVFSLPVMSMRPISKRAKPPSSSGAGDESCKLKENCSCHWRIQEFSVGGD